MKGTLIKRLYGMKRKAHGARQPELQQYVEAASAAQRVHGGDSPVRTFNRRFLIRASNSLLILLSYPFMAFVRLLVSPPGDTWAPMRHTPHLYIFRHGKSALCRVLFQTSSSPRSFYHVRLGEERIRGLVCVFFAFCLLASYSFGETRASVAEDISAIIRTEITAMPEWSDADIRIEIINGVKNTDILAAGESFRLAPQGLTFGSRSVIAPIEVIRDGKFARSLSVSAVVNISAPAIVAARKIASGTVITDRDIREGIVETTDIGAVLARSPEDIVGKTARRVFAIGKPLPLDAFSEPPLIRRGDMVSLRLERGGITLTSAAHASENGRLGEIIQVKNIDFSSVVKARVTGPAEVTIQ